MTHLFTDEPLVRQMPARLHALMQNTNDFDQIRLNDAEIENMDGAAHGSVCNITAGVPNVQAAEPGM